MDWVFAERSKGVLYRVLFCCSLGECVAIQEDGKEIEKQAEPGSEFWTEAWSAFLQSFVQHLEEKGWFDRMILAMDERPKEEMEAALNLIATSRTGTEIP